MFFLTKRSMLLSTVNVPMYNVPVRTKNVSSKLSETRQNDNTNHNTKLQTAYKPKLCESEPDYEPDYDLYKVQAIALIQQWNLWKRDCRNEVRNDAGNVMYAREYAKRLLDCYDMAVSLMDDEGDRAFFRLIMEDPWNTNVEFQVVER